MALPKLGEKKILWDPNCGNAIAENGKKKFVLAIVAMALPKMKKKKIVLAIVAMTLLKMEKKKKMLRNLLKSKKKKLSRPQYFHNKLHMINYY